MNFGNRQINIGGAAYRPAYYRHSQFYHGYWNGNQGYGFGYPYGGHRHSGYRNYGWNNGYAYRPYFWGLGGWGLGSLMYGSGYLGYTNPYYYNTGGTAYCYNYAQPIPVAYNTANSAYVANTDSTIDPNAAVANPAEAIMNSAVATFKQNDYDGALNIINQGITQFPDDSVLHEFRSLILFAKGEYQQAAATIHSVLAVGPGWDWTTLSSFYAEIGLYTTQLRALESAVKQNPQDGAGHFLLAYHYMSEGYPDAAAKQLQQVIELVPSDQVAANLLKMTSPQQPTGSSETIPQPSAQPPVNPLETDQVAAIPINPSTIIGDWKSSRDDGSSFALALKSDQTFTWSFAPKQQPPQTFDGKYALDGNVIALERNGGGSLVATISDNDGTHFNFKMVGAPDEDPGLNFIK